MLICVLIIVFSGVMYVLGKVGIITGTTWCPEIYGFIWGIILSNVKDKFAGWMNKKWLVKVIAFCILAGILGIAYLKLKPVVFFGDYVLKIILGLAIIVFMLAANTRIEIGNKVSLFLGSISYEVYLLHGIVFALISYFAPEIISGLFIVTSIVVTVVLAVLIHQLGEPISRKIIKALS